MTAKEVREALKTVLAKKRLSAEVSLEELKRIKDQISNQQYHLNGIGMTETVKIARGVASLLGIDLKIKTKNSDD